MTYIPLTFYIKSRFILHVGIFRVRSDGFLDGQYSTCWGKQIFFECLLGFEMRGRLRWVIEHLSSLSSFYQVWNKFSSRICGNLSAEPPSVQWNMFTLIVLQGYVTVDFLFKYPTHICLVSYLRAQHKN